MCENLLSGDACTMNTKWIRNIGLGALAAVVCIGGVGSARAEHHYNGHNHNHGCSPQYGYSNYGYRPIVVAPYYGNNFGVGSYYGNYGGYSSNYGGYNNYGSGYGVGGYPAYGSYGGGAFPRGGSYGGGAFPQGGSYGGGGFSLHIGR